MKKLLTLFFLGAIMSQLVAQAPLRSHNLRFKQAPMPRNKVAMTGMEPVGQVIANPNLPLLDRSLGENTLGETLYDLQSNSSTPNRVTKLADGTLYGTYTFGADALGGYPDRGTGYNVFTPSSQSWGPYATARIEDVRTGWPNVVTLADGTVVTVAHTSDAKLRVSKNVGGTWQYSDVPTAAPPGLLWPRMEVGGADGNTLHVIAITLPTGNGGAVYDGCDGHILYFRSTDGGTTWDKQDIKLPDVNSDFYSRMDADSYAIDASGETVAVGIIGDYGDVKIAKSSDNGDTWTTWTVKDFPIDGYVLDSGYTYDQLPSDPNAPDSLAIQSSDNAGDVLVDNDGKVHLWYGEMYIMDDAAANSSYYPATMGLHYWNEDMDEDASVYAVEGIIDANGNGTADIAAISDIALYYASLTSHPSAGIDADGRIYVAYSGLTENYINPDATPNQQHNRHVYVIFSEDGGSTWSDPLDLTSEDYVEEFTDFSGVYETMFPAIARHVDYRADIIYQQDFEPGLSVRGDMDAASTNYINHIGLDVADLGIISNTTTVSPDVFDFAISPNPSSSMSILTYELAAAEPVTINVANALGQVVKTAKLGVQNQGKHGFDLNTSTFADGMYIVTLQAGDRIASSKLVVR